MHLIGLHYRAELCNGTIRFYSFFFLFYVVHLREDYCLLVHFFVVLMNPGMCVRIY